MRLEVERSGGFAGRTVQWGLDTDSLDAAGQAEVQELLAGAHEWPAATGADRFSYRVTVEQPAAAPLEVRFGEPLGEAAQRLVAVVRSHG